MMKFRFSLILSTSLLLPGSACQPATEPGDVLPVEFVYGIHRLQAEPAFVVDASANVVQVRGYLRTPCQPYHASAYAEVIGNTLVLRVIGKARGDCPQDVITSIGYQATVRAGRAEYDRVRVTHEWRDANWPAETVVSQQLQTQAR